MVMVCKVSAQSLVSEMCFGAALLKWLVHSTSHMQQVVWNGLSWGGRNQHSSVSRTALHFIAQSTKIQKGRPQLDYVCCPCVFVVVRTMGHSCLLSYVFVCVFERAGFIPLGSHRNCIQYNVPACINGCPDAIELVMRCWGQVT